MEYSRSDIEYRDKMIDELKKENEKLRKQNATFGILLFFVGLAAFVLLYAYYIA